MKKTIVSASPHIASPIGTKNLMLDVIISLIPVCISVILIFGFYPVLVIGVSVGAAVLGEFLYNKITRQKQTVSDLSAVVTGLILGLNLPPVIPLYVPLIGGIYATMVVKMLFGGLGKNFANPAITARIFLLLAWGGMMTTFVPPIDLSQGFGSLFTYFSGVDAVTTATPLATLTTGSTQGIDLSNMFFGMIGGSSGEVCSIAILIGGAYLAFKRVIDIRIPLVYVGTSAILSLFFYSFDFAMVLPQILGGGLLFGAVFMATDYSTSPNTKAGIYVYAVGLGVMTMLIRRFANMTEGVSFAILLMNIVTPLLDKYIVPAPFGFVKVKKAKAKKEA